MRDGTWNCAVSIQENTSSTSSRRLFWRLVRCSAIYRNTSKKYMEMENIKQKQNLCISNGFVASVPLKPFLTRLQQTADGSSISQILCKVFAGFIFLFLKEMDIRCCSYTFCHCLFCPPLYKFPQIFLKTHFTPSFWLITLGNHVISAKILFNSRQTVLYLEFILDSIKKETNYVFCYKVLLAKYQKKSWSFAKLPGLYRLNTSLELGALFWIHIHTVS